MATFSAVTRQHVLQAIAEHDSRGPDDFLGVYGFTPSTSTFEHEGRTYDAPAVVGVAHRYATGRLATADEVTTGTDAILALLVRRGFDVPQLAAAPAAAPAARTRAPRAAKPATARPAAARRTPAPAVPERVAPVCPTCSMTLPATGVCDYCS
ncbi:hypothetical protein [Cellulomonas fimi]|uniref:hypothetical protein n=1 Tax=Cellulomonas fimi TaxID=1708 RepID=UPI00059F9F9D|nr:hypothetical protein [Cellulomonas fimi]NNH05703.1 hypothetical protein [Cellulomonas fimi]